MTRLCKHIAALFDPTFPQRELASAIMIGERTESLERRLKRVSDVNEVLPIYGLTPLELAIDRGSGSIVELLLEKEADTEQKSNVQWTPLLRACYHGCLDAVENLVQYGADLTAKTQDGFTCLFVAAKNKHVSVVSYLLECKSCSVDGVDEDGYTTLHHVVFLDNSDIISKLVNKELDINAQTLKGETASFLATKHNHPASLKVLLSSGADPDITTNNGESALVEAMTQGCVDMVVLLTNHGADCAAFDKNGESPVRLAVEVMIASKQKNNAQPQILQVVDARGPTNPPGVVINAVEAIGHIAGAFGTMFGGG